MKKLILPVAFSACIAFGVWWYFGGQGWLAAHTGTDNCINVPVQYLQVCKAYGFWSGFGSDLGEFALVTGIWGNAILLWRKHTCDHSWWCWRHPAYQLEGTQFHVCAHHHPDDVPASAKEAVAQMQKGVAHASLGPPRPTWWFRYRVRCTCGWSIKRWNVIAAEKAMAEHEEADNGDRTD